MGASFKRVQIAGNSVHWIDRDFVDKRYKMILSKKISALQTPPKEIAFSYECAACGAPYTDTTNDTCTYCGAPVIDLAQNWVLTDFNG
jgi:rubrerythrin